MGMAIGGVVAGVGSLIGGSTAQSADNKAAQQGLTGYNYLTGPSGTTGYVSSGNAANSEEAQLLGVAGPASGGGTMPSTGYTYAPNNELMATLNNGSPAYGADLRGQVTSMINSGASPQQIQAAIHSWAGHTTDPSNAAARDALVSAAGRLTPQAMSGTQGSATGTPAGMTGPTGNNAFNNYLNSTGYQFQLGQGEQALTGSAAARGILNSGATDKALTRYGQNLASGYFNNYLTQLNSVGNQGLTAAGQIGSAGTQGGATAANATNAGGVSMGNAITNTANMAGGLATNYFGSI